MTFFLLVIIIPFSSSSSSLTNSSKVLRRNEESRACLLTRNTYLEETTEEIIVEDGDYSHSFFNSSKSISRLTMFHQLITFYKPLLTCPTKHHFSLTKKDMASTGEISDWYPADTQLIRAIFKITILVLLKIILKYYITVHFKSIFQTSNPALYHSINLFSKATTIAVAKLSIKWSLYPALRTAFKTFLIALFKALFKPLLSPLLKRCKLVLKQNPQSDAYYATIYLVTLFTNIASKTVIKTLVLKMLTLLFVSSELSHISLTWLMFRVAVIIVVKMIAKKGCKWLKTSNKVKQEIDPSPSSSAPVDKMLMFAIQKLVTKLVKIPVITILLA